MSIDTEVGKPNPSIWEKLEWEPSKEQLQQLIDLQCLLIKWNKKVNLTRLLMEDDYWINQIFDSLWPIKNQIGIQTDFHKCIDIGSGCGFPGLAIAIAQPSLQVTLVDSIAKKTNALVKIICDLGLSSRVQVITQRIEIIGQSENYREGFDLAIARAVASPAIVAEYLIPLLRSKGEGFLYRGKWTNDNKKELTKALFLLNAQIKDIQRIELPNNRGERNLIIIESTSKCPKSYPRLVGIPSKKPLGE